MTEAGPIHVESSPDAAPGPALVITGMHRSGTSLVAALLQSAGMHIGEHLLPADCANSRGYFENMDFLEFHRGVLRSHNLDENGLTEAACPIDGAWPQQARDIVRRNARPDLWGWKDPRTALFLDFWGELLPDARFVFLFRAPWLVVDSLFRRGTDRALYFQPTLAALAWLRYNRALLKFYQQFPRRCILLDVQQVAQHPAPTVAQIGRRFALPLAAPREDIFHQEMLAGPNGADLWELLLVESFPETLACYNQLRTSAGLPEVAGVGANRPEFRDEVMQRWLELHTIDRRNVQGAHWLHEKNGPGPADTVLELDELRRRQQATAEQLPALRQHVLDVEQRQAITERRLAEVTTKIEAQLHPPMPVNMPDATIFEAGGSDAGPAHPPSANGDQEQA